jgi:hypothetical protein
MEQNELIVLFDETTVNKENNQIPLKFICDSLGIDYEYQVRQTSSNPVLQKYMEKVSNEELYGDKRQRLAFSKKGFLIFILGLAAESIPKENREKFYMYQEFIFDYLYDDAMLRESLTKNRLMLTNQLKQLEKEIENNEIFKQYTALKEKIRLTEAEFKKLNYRLTSKIQGTINFESVSE